MYRKLILKELFPSAKRNYSIISNCRLLFQPMSLPQRSRKCLQLAKSPKFPFSGFQILSASTSAPISGSLDSPTTSSTPELTLDLWEVPAPPALPTKADLLGSVVEGLPATPGVGESSWFLSNWLSYFMDYLHLTTGYPWCACIAVSVVIVRVVVLPFMIKTQQHASIMMNHQPEVNRITERLKQAQNKNDTIAQQEATMDYADLYNRIGLHPLGPIFYVIPQAVLFVSYYFALRHMAEAPTPGFESEGLAWFMDLSVQDPTFCLPLICCSTLFGSIYYSINYGASVGLMTPEMRLGMYCLPGIALAFMCFRDFPAAVIWYWTMTNAFTLLMNVAMQNSRVRKWCKIQERKKLDSETTKRNNQSILDRIKELLRR